MKQGIHRLWILLLTVLPWAGVSAGPALAAVQADLARADRAAAEQAARRLMDASPVDGEGDPESPATHAAESQRSTDESRFVSAPSAIKPGDSDSNTGINLALAGGAVECDTHAPLERVDTAATVTVVSALHYPIYQAQAPPPLQS